MSKQYEDYGQYLEDAYEACCDKMKENQTPTEHGTRQ
jgi:hypothetical protein